MTKRTRKRARSLGRPPTLTRDVQIRICRTIAQCNYFKTAALAAGVPYRTAKEWLQKGLADDAEEPYRGFAEAIEMARAKAEVTLVAQAKAGKQHKYRAAQFMLERLTPSHWGANRIKTALEIQALRAQLHKSDAAGDITVVVECEPAPSETPVAPDVAPGGDLHRP